MATALALLSACGGGGDEAAEASAATAAGTDTAAAATTDGTTTTTEARTAQALAVSTPTLTVRARATLYGGVGPIMVVRINGVQIGSVEVRSTTTASYSFSAATLVGGAKVEVVFTNDQYNASTGEDRNLYIEQLSDGTSTVLPTATGAVVDWGSGAEAFDNVLVWPGRTDLTSAGALRLTWPVTTTASTAATVLAQRAEASRFLMQATFGPTPGDIDTVLAKGQSGWIDAQLALPVTDHYVPYVDLSYSLGPDYRAGGSKRDGYRVSTAFWSAARSAPDQLRRRTAFALHQILMASMNDSTVAYNDRAYAHYLDGLNRHALGNFRALLEEVALSPAMGLYLSHLRNRKEDTSTGRLPDENFAREVMQLFTIGLYELNSDGSYKRDSAGKPIETYGNADVMAMAKVFTGFSWGFPDSQLTEANFLWGGPDYTQAVDQRLDVQRMKAYPGQHSTAQKTLFAGKSWAVTLPAGATAANDLRIALDTLFNHPNVGPFIGRQLIQRLVTSQPSAAYVGRVAAVFANNGKGVRGDLAAVVRAILTDAEARGTPTATSGKLREPVLRVAHWMRAFESTSVSNTFTFSWDVMPTGQMALYAPSVFGYFRPGYVPPNTAFSTSGMTVPEFQIVNEATAASWVNLAENMAWYGLGWVNNRQEISSAYAEQVRLLNAGDTAGFLDSLDVMLMGGRMSTSLRQAITDAMATVWVTGSGSALARTRMAVFIVMASPEYLVQR
ncbi:putative xylan-binding protein with Ca-dependent carbohydrate-binding module [Sphaerotilus hippei]|uniref:Putative xylan-binding protein with Ca-dependent carbohydrate-binding module n=2 Tax=Sphaerotilus hippei TaxID=744406 RepID=A0A318HE41_9BURK|nr:putative xylan-binding protein with Ca-dependent carbohydrate-binding module [Sphaerotilus hippei]